MPLVAYAAFGPSRVMVLGPDSSLAAVIAAVILPLGGDDPETAVALAGALAVLTGLGYAPIPPQTWGFHAARRG